MRVDDPLPLSEGKVHFTGGPSRTEAEHPLHQGLEIGQKTVVVNKKGEPLYQVNPLFLIRYVVIE